MLVFSTTFAIFFFTLLIGWVWKHSHAHSLADGLIGYIAKSLWISWIIIFISFFSPLGVIMRPLIFLTSIYILIRWKKNSKSIYLSVHSPFATIVLSTSFVLGFLYLKEIGFFQQYQTIFYDYDAVFSWNRWAIELFSNHYEPVAHTAYPIFWPGLWSLIYEVQTDASIWIAAKSTLLIIPISLLIYSLLSFFQGRYLSTLLCCGVSFILMSKLQLLTNGYMDYPVATMTLLSLVVLNHAAFDIEQGAGNSVETISFAVMLAGIATITKQAGILTFFPLFVTCYSLFQKNYCTKKDLYIWAFLFTLPIVTYFIMYFPGQDTIIGNLENFQKLSTKVSQGQNTIPYSFNLLKSASYPSFLYALFGAASLNVLHPKSTLGRLGIVNFLIALLGLIIFADCCSYAQRNGIWIYSFLCASAIAGITPFQQKVKEKFKYSFSGSTIGISLIVSATFISLFAALTIDKKTIRDIQLKKQAIIGKKAINNLLDVHQKKLGPTGLILSSYRYAGILPNYQNRYAYCGWSYESCIGKNTLGSYEICPPEDTDKIIELSCPIEDVLSKHPQSLFLVRKKKTQEEQNMAFWKTIANLKNISLHEEGASGNYRIYSIIHTN